MDSQTLISGAVTIGVGALSGGITNAVAVWMLFHPHEPVELGLFTLHGAIPKNKARLARSIGRVVGERLLTAEDLSRRLEAPAVRALFDRAIEGILEGILTRDHGPLSESLGPDLVEAIRGALPGMARQMASRLAEYSRSPEFEATAARWIGQGREELADVPLSATLTPDRQAKLAAQVDRWVSGLVDGNGLAEPARRFILRQIEHLESDRQPLEERIPPAWSARSSRRSPTTCRLRWPGWATSWPIPRRGASCRPRCARPSTARFASFCCTSGWWPSWW